MASGIVPYFQLLLEVYPYKSAFSFYLRNFVQMDIVTSFPDIPPEGLLSEGKKRRKGEG